VRNGVWRACLWTAALAAVSCRRPAQQSAPLTISVPFEIDTLDPHARNIAGNFAIASHFYEPLVLADPGLELRPALAARWDNPDARTWIFHLRRGVRFHSGRALTSRDVVFSFQRLARTPALEISVYLSGVDAVKALDAHTVELTTKRPSAILLAALPFVLIVPEGSDSAALAEREDGTGPYRLQSWTKPGEIRMARHDGYHGTKPAFGEVAFTLQRGPEQALQDLTAGRSRLVQCNSKTVEELTRGVAGLRVARKTSLFVKQLSFDLVRPETPFVPGLPNPFRRREVREAVSLAIDRRALVKRLSTYAMPASQPLPPFVFGYDASLPVAAADPARARALLGQAGYPDGFAVTLHVRAQFDETARIVAEMLSGVGIRTALASMSDPEFFDLMNHDRLSFFLSRFGCPTGDADLLFQQRFRTPMPGAGGRGAVFSPNLPALDAEIDASAEIVEMEKRHATLQKLIRTVVEEVFWVPLYIDEDVYALRDDLLWQPRSDSYVLAQEVGAR